MGISHGKLGDYCRKHNIEIRGDFEMIFNLTVKAKKGIMVTGKRARNPGVPVGVEGKKMRKEFDETRKKEAMENPDHPDPLEHLKGYGLTLGCSECKNIKNADERCMRVMKVQKQQNVKKLVGSVLTCAPEDDRLEPKVRVPGFPFIL